MKAKGWLRAEAVVKFPEHHSDPMNIKPILLAIKGRKYPWIGWYFGGLVKEFRMEGSPSEVFPSHWMPLPEMPSTHHAKGK